MSKKQEKPQSITKGRQRKDGLSKKEIPKGSKNEAEYNRVEQLLETLAMFTNQDHGAVTVQEMTLVDEVYTAALDLEDYSEEDHMQLIAETLHRKWLSKSDFAPTAIKIVKRLSEQHPGGHSDLMDGEKIWNTPQNFRNIIHGFVWEDYKDRKTIRNTSRQIYANAAHFTIEFFMNFYNQNEETQFLFLSMVEPLFHYIAGLVDATASEIEVDKAHIVLSQHGPLLNRLRPNMLFDILLDVRLKLVESIGLADRSRAQLLHLLELSMHGWDTEQLPARVRRLFHTRLSRGSKQSRRCLKPVGLDGRGGDYVEHAAESAWDD